MDNPNGADYWMEQAKVYRLWWKKATERHERAMKKVRDLEQKVAEVTTNLENCRAMYDALLKEGRHVRDVQG